MQADALVELASVLQLAGKTHEAEQAIDEAVALYTAKGNVVSASRFEAWAREHGLR